MKLCAALLLLFTAGFSLPLGAQEQQAAPEQFIPSGAPVYFPGVSGTGSRPEDNGEFSLLIQQKLAERGYAAQDAQENTEFFLIATLAPQTDNGGENGVVHATESDGIVSIPQMHRQMFVLRLLMQDNAFNTLINQEMFYIEPEEINDLITLTFSTLPFITWSWQFTQNGGAPGFNGYYAPAPAAQPVSDEWRNRQWYFGASLFWSPRVYRAEERSTYYINFGAGLYADYRFQDFLAAGAGLELVPDWVMVDDLPGGSYRDLVLEIPLVMKYIIKPSSYFMLEPYAGLNLNLALYRETRPSIIAWRLGFQYGVKAGPGALVIDPWFSMDILPSRLGGKYADDSFRYRRFMMHVGVGYKYGIGSRPERPASAAPALLAEEPESEPASASAQTPADPEQPEPVTAEDS